MKFIIRTNNKKGKIINEEIIEAFDKVEATRIILDRLNISVINQEDEVGSVVSKGTTGTVEKGVNENGGN